MVKNSISPKYKSFELKFNWTKFALWTFSKRVSSQLSTGTLFTSICSLWKMSVWKGLNISIKSFLNGCVLICGGILIRVRHFFGNAFSFKAKLLFPNSRESEHFIPGIREWKKRRESREYGNGNTRVTNPTYRVNRKSVCTFLESIISGTGKILAPFDQKCEFTYVCQT